MLTITSKRATSLILFFGVIVIISLIGVVAINAAFSVTDDIYSGVKVGDINVGGLSVQAAENKINTDFQEKLKHPPIVLTYDGQQWVITAKDIGLSINSAELAGKAYDIGRTGNLFIKLKEKYLTINRGSTVPLKPSYDRKKVETVVNSLAKAIDREPQNAGLSYSKSAVTVQPESTGRKVDIQKTLDNIYAQLETSFPITLSITVTELQPSIKVADLDGITSLISSYSTQFNPWDQNRTENIMIAARNINGIILKNGESFSFNKLVGPRLSQHGYKIAPVFINGKLTPDWGGGVCQVSSTLYNAVLLADMTIEERTAHCRPPGYVPLGQGRDRSPTINLILDLKIRPATAYIFPMKYLVIRSLSQYLAN